MLNVIRMSKWTLCRILRIRFIYPRMENTDFTVEMSIQLAKVILGAALKRAREEKGWTQAYVAELVDRDSRTIMKIGRASCRERV